MGQKISKASFPVTVLPFCGLSKKSIAAIWQTFNDISNGFGITLDECGEICVDLFAEMNVTRESVKDMSAGVFVLFDTDGNDLIDALEFIGTLSVISGMRLVEILEFILKMYDFDGKLMLSLDELTLSLRTIACGLCKIVGIHDFPREEVVEELTTRLFYDEAPNFDDMTRVKISTLVDKLSLHPDICSWYAHYGNPVIQISDIHKVPQVVDGQKASSTEAAKQEDVPWMSAVALLQPIKYANVLPKDVMPSSSIELQWIYGYQSEKCSKNVYYNCDGDMIYNLSRYVIVYNTIGNKQKIFSGHANEVSAIVMHPNREIMASGERVQSPKLILWSTKTLDVSFHRNLTSGESVTDISFSAQGRLVAALTKSSKFDVYIFQWEENVMVFSCSIEHLDCHAVSFLRDESLVVGGKSFMYFWCYTQEGYVQRTGIFSKHTGSQVVTCLGQSEFNDCIISGTQSGLLMIWNDRNCLRHVKAHDGRVNCIYSCVHGILSGGKDFRIRMWTQSLDPGATFDISSFGPCPEIRALCLSSDGTSIVLGTKGSTLFEISAIDGSDLRGGAITNGHSVGSIYCLCPHPSKLEVATVGEDRQLYIWDVTSKLLLRQAKFEAPITSVCYNPLGDVVVVGMGGEANKPFTGTYVCLNEEDLTKVHEAKDSTFPVSALKFSPDGETLAVACDDGSIYLYAVNDDYELIGRCLRHTSRVVHLDFSVDGEWMRSNSNNGELYFFNTDDASFQSNIASLRDVEWSTMTCVFSWHTKSIHSSLFPGEIVTSLHAPSGTASEFVLCGSSIGHLKIHPFPCAHDLLPCQRYPGHVGTISSLRFSYDSEFVLTSGQSDNCVLQWRCLPFKPLPEQGNEDDAESEDFALEAARGSEVDVEVMPDTVEVPDVRIAQDLTGTGLDPDCDVWQELVVSPNNVPVQNKDLPAASLRLEYVHGVRAQDMRNMVAYTANNEIVMVSSSLGVVMNRKNRAQRFFQGHTDRITSMSTSKDGSIAATGQIGKQPLVHVWSTESCTTLFTVKVTHCHCVSSVALSNSGKYLAICFLDDLNTISVYDWAKELLISTFNSGRRRILSVAFSEDEHSLCAVAIKDLTIWTNIRGRQPKSLKPDLGEIGQIQPFVIVRHFNGKFVVGTADGYLYVFNETAITHAVKAHSGKVYSLDVSPSGKQLVTGGKDGAVRLWNRKLECVKEIQVESLLVTHDPKVRSVKFSSNDGNVLVCTRGAEVFEISLTSSTLVGGKVSLVSHGARELWGLAAHPTKDEFVTTGDDLSLRIWDATNFSLVRTVKMDTPSRCVAYSPCGRYLAVGFGSGKRIKGRPMPKEGAFVVLSAGDQSVIHEGKDSNESIRVARYSPDSTILVLGSDDSNIYVYNVKDEYSKKAVIQCHKAPLRTIDFSLDGAFIMSSDVTYRFKFSDANTGIEVPNPAVFRDEKWATFSSPVGWAVQGLWMNRLGEETLSSLQRSGSKQLVAAGTSHGRITVAHYPCYGRAGAIHGRGHCGPISQMVWLPGDGKIVSIGVKDHCIFQWRCEYDASRESGDEGGLSCDDSIVDKDGGRDAGFVKKRKPMAVTVAPTSANAESDVPQTFGENTWMQYLCPPANFKDVPHKNIKCFAEIEFTHGARLNDSRQTLSYNYDGDVIFAAGSLGVVLNRAVYQFRCYHGHENAILSLAVNPEGQLVASGELAEDPAIHIWNSRTLANVSVIRGMHRTGVTCMTFSQSNEFLVSLGQDPLHGIVVYRSATKAWTDPAVLYSTPVCCNKLLWINFVDGNDFPIITGGKKAIFFIRQSAKSAERIRGIFGKRFKIQPLLCAVESHQAPNQSKKQLLTGTVSGHIYLWTDNRVTRAVTAHDAPINAITKVWFGYVTGGKEGIIKVWNQELKLMHSYNLQTFSPQPFFPSCHTLRVNRKGTKLLVGMKGGEVYEIALSTHSTMLLSEAHSTRQIHALDVNPNNSDEFVSGGDDGFMRIWSIMSKRCVRRVNVECAIRSFAWSATKPLILIGVGGDPTQAVKDGAFMAMNSVTLEVEFEDRKAKKHIQDIKFSPSEEVFACSSADGRVYIHDTATYTLQKVIEIPTKFSAVRCCDFSTNNETLRFATVSDDVYYFNLKDKEIIPSPATVRDVAWSTFNCPFTWETQGIWTPGGAKVLDVVKSDVLNKIAVSYDDSTIKIFNFPCLSCEDPFVALHGIATNCCRLKFTPDGKYLVVLDTYCRAVSVFNITT